MLGSTPGLCQHLPSHANVPRHVQWPGGYLRSTAKRESRSCKSHVQHVVWTPQPGLSDPSLWSRVTRLPFCCVRLCTTTEQTVREYVHPMKTRMRVNNTPISGNFLAAPEVWLMLSDTSACLRSHRRTCSFKNTCKWARVTSVFLPGGCLVRSTQAASTSHSERPRVTTSLSCSVSCTDGQVGFVTLTEGVPPPVDLTGD